MLPLVLLLPADPLTLGASTPTTLDGVGPRHCSRKLPGDRPYDDADVTIWAWDNHVYEIIPGVQIQARDAYGREIRVVFEADGTPGDWMRDSHPDAGGRLPVSAVIELDRIVRARVAAAYGRRA